MGTIIICLLSMGVLNKFFKIVKNLAITIISVVCSMISILVLMRLIVKWIIIPSLKAIKYVAKKFWVFMQWIGNIMDKHFIYRNDNKYWELVATSMDRKSV